MQTKYKFKLEIFCAQRFPCSQKMIHSKQEWICVEKKEKLLYCSILEMIWFYLIKSYSGLKETWIFFARIPLDEVLDDAKTMKTTEYSQRIIDNVYQNAPFVARVMLFPSWFLCSLVRNLTASNAYNKRLEHQCTVYTQMHFHGIIRLNYRWYKLVSVAVRHSQRNLISRNFLIHTQTHRKQAKYETTVYLYLI